MAEQEPARTIQTLEKPIQDLEEKLEKLKKKLNEDPDNTELKTQVEELEDQIQSVIHDIYSNLTPWERVLVARHPRRPHALDYIEHLITDWVELHGDRGFADDPAVVTGFGSFRGRSVAVIGQQKGKDARDNVARNFGMMHPEGYRKAMRIMNIASRFGKPILIFIDTPGAYPGIGAEERGQAEAIARNIRDMFMLKVPVLCVVIGEGASGGALGVGLGDRVLMMQNAWYCVISPEGCASILWRSAEYAPRAAVMLRLTATDLIDLKIIDEIIPEPLGGAHRYPDQAFEAVGAAIEKNLTELLAKPLDTLLQERFEKYRRMGSFAENQAASLAPTGE
ncbi:MAG: acetyl-CoA carboxylase carboxyltransferase subunit alpha [Candidatus Sumerlaeia bacterium]